MLLEYFRIRDFGYKEEHLSIDGTNCATDESKMDTKKFSATVSKALRAAGHSASVIKAGRNTTGFKLKQMEDGSVKIEHRNNGCYDGNIASLNLTRYAAALNSFSVELVKEDYSAYLVCRVA